MTNPPRKVTVQDVLDYHAHLDQMALNPVKEPEKKPAPGLRYCMDALMLDPIDREMLKQAEGLPLTQAWLRKDLGQQSVTPEEYFRDRVTNSLLSKIMSEMEKINK